jgi:hypothetical protein
MDITIPSPTYRDPFETFKLKALVEFRRFEARPLRVVVRQKEASFEVLENRG